mgnify:CR=1 FL=1
MEQADNANIATVVMPNFNIVFISNPPLLCQVLGWIGAMIRQEGDVFEAEALPSIYMGPVTA